MSNISNLLLNQIRESLEKLSKSGVGYINFETSTGIQYQIDGRYFDIRIEEVDEKSDKRSALEILGISP